MRVALVPMNPTVGDVAGNAALVLEGIARARDAGADLVVFPELALCGYPPKDLLTREGFIEACAAAAKEIGERHTKGITLVLGLPLPRDPKSHAPGGAIHNSLLVYTDNRHVDYYDKRLLPTYDVFDEDRYFVPGARAVVVEVPVHGGDEPVRVGLSICEDLWKGEDAGFAHRYKDAPDPVAELIAAGARVIVCPSASPFVLGKQEKHRAILAGHAKRHGVVVVSLNQLGGNDELVFDGHALAYGRDGALMAAAEFSAGMQVVEIEGKDRSLVEAEPVPERRLFEALKLGIADYLRKTGFKRALIGLSGGIDSALTAALAAAALGPRNVLGVLMPGKYSSSHSVEDALDLGARLGIGCDTVPIDGPLEAFRGPVDGFFGAHGLPRLGERLPDLTEENIQSRIRGTILMTLSNRTGAIVLTTGNKSELAVGYCTLYGDMNGGLAVLSDVSKQWVYRLSRWMNANHGACGLAQPPIPQRSIDKAPSAELRPDQTDQDSLPPYDVLDEIIERVVERRQGAARVARETGLDGALVRKIARMIDTTEYKRQQAAIGLKVTTVAFGSGRRMPVAQGWREA